MKLPTCKYPENKNLTSTNFSVILESLTGQTCLIYSRTFMEIIEIENKEYRGRVKGIFQFFNGFIV